MPDYPIREPQTSVAATPTLAVDSGGTPLPKPPALAVYQFAAKSAPVTIAGEFLDIDQNAIGSYSLALTYTAADNAGYLANMKTFANASTTFLPGKTIADAVVFTFPGDQASNVLFNTGAVTSLPITTRTLTLGNTITIGKVA